ncbi:MAG: dihydropteroate synthase [Dehalococcoidia bacterium]
MLLIGQSLELVRPALLAAVRAEDSGAVVGHAHAQVASGAGGIDINGGAAADHVDLAWCARVLGGALPGVTLLIDTAATLLLAEVLDACHRAGAPATGTLVANSLPAGDGGAFPEDARLALRVAARTGAGIVVSPRLADDLAVAPASSAERVIAAGRMAAERARAEGITGAIYLDALAFPPSVDPARCARALGTLRAWREAGGAEPLVAVGNVGFGAPRVLAPALRAVYAAAAVGAGATALILPVEEAGTVRAARLAAGEVTPDGPEEEWLVAAARATAAGEQPPVPPASLEAAARAIFGG